MATSVLQKQKTGSWSGIFPTEQVTQQQSALFVKKLLAVAISNITYLRTIFPEHAFGDRCLEDLNLKILRDDNTCPGACQVIQWVKGCFDALDRKYLRMIIVGIYMDADDPVTAVETYSFKFDYTNQKGVAIFRNDKEIASAYSETETKKATIKLLRTIIVLTQTLQPLPDDVMMTMKLYYYDDVTPEDYEPPGFQPTTPEGFEFEESAVNIRIGEVATPFHSVKLRIKTGSSQFTPSATHNQDMLQHLQQAEQGGGAQGEKGGGEKDEGAAEKEPGHVKGETVVEEMETVAADGHVTGSAQEPTNRDSSKEELASHPKPEIHASEDNFVRCPCSVNEDDGLMVLCAVCQVWQHAVCYGFLQESQVPEQHICILCSRHSGQRCTDPSLPPLAAQQLQNACLWRRTLHACCDLTRLVTPGLARRLGVGHGVAQTIMDRLETEGYIRPPQKGRKWGRVVMKEKVLKEGIPKYFPKHPTRDQDTAHQDTPLIGQDKPLTQAKIQDILTNGDTKLKSQNTKTGLDSLTTKAADLSISTTKAADVSVSGGMASQRPPTRPLLLQEQDTEVRRSPRIRAKRVRAALDESKEFELCCSQDTEEQPKEGELPGGRGRKRRKASIASTSIMV